MRKQEVPGLFLDIPTSQGVGEREARGETGRYPGDTDSQKHTGGHSIEDSNRKRQEERDTDRQKETGTRDKGKGTEHGQGWRVRQDRQPVRRVVEEAWRMSPVGRGRLKREKQVGAQR